ncbi:LacI family transcriptional regulator [Sediminibacterium roseum]|uniref:LacI family transcriptional regulator n=1 Tax=Sediminibacterium roseum TaxID=1978412 RepID=A0ABW9ZRC4_9BACT|nr:LacI family DNA-binding transcriptional regulator [Sediminibacterium roseum]NCI49012.1 LacI family transcriptional regulator [Sediminibacterium roseum]
MKLRPQTVTLKDIARAMGLSIATVSKALRDSHEISPATKQRVCDYAEKHKYRPNLMAQMLRHKNGRSIGVIIGAIPNNFFSDVLNGMESVTFQKDYHFIITQSLESLQREKKNLEHLTWRAVDGLLVSLSAETQSIDHFKKVHESGIPIVFYDRVTNEIKTHQVVSDNVDGTYKGTMHLLENGFSRIAHITSSKELSITQERLIGYKNALEEKNIFFNNDYVKYCAHGGKDRDEVEEAIDQLLAMKPMPDALITASDRITISALAILKKKNISIPSQIAIVGYSNFSAPEVFQPELTTIHQPAFEIGRAAAELLIKLIETKRPPTKFEKRILPVELQVRESSLRVR